MCATRPSAQPSVANATSSIPRVVCRKQLPVALTVTGAAPSRNIATAMSCGASDHQAFSFARTTPAFTRSECR